MIPFWIQDLVLYRQLGELGLLASDLELDQGPTSLSCELVAITMIEGQGADYQ